MTFKQQMIADLDIFFNTDEFAENITYTPAGGSPASVSAILGDENAAIQDPVPAGDTMRIYVKAGEVPSPNYKDTFTIGGEVWYLRANLSGGANDGIWQLEISRSERRPI